MSTLPEKHRSYKKKKGCIIICSLFFKNTINYGHVL